MVVYVPFVLVQDEATVNISQCSLEILKELDGFFLWEETSPGLHGQPIYQLVIIFFGHI